MGSTCQVERGVCETGTGSEDAACGRGCPGCGTKCGGDPYECGVAMWTAAFFQAMKAAQVDLLKSKIQKAWGPKMEKAADAVLEAMGVHWQSMLAQAKAKEDVRGLLRKLWQEGSK